MLQQRHLIPVVLVSALASGWASRPAQAAIPPNLLCSDTQKVNCFQDEIFILDGNSTFDVIPTGATEPVKQPIVTGCTLETVAGQSRPICTDLIYDRTVSLLRGLLADRGLRGPWDTVAVFGADFPAEKKLDGTRGGVGPSFFRIGGVNEIDGIGLTFRRRGNEPFVGYIAAGSTTNFGTFITPTVPPPTGLAAWPEPNPAGVEGYAESYPECDGDAICFSGYHNGYQALASAVGQMYGPYVDKGIDDRQLRSDEEKQLPVNPDPPQRSGLARPPALKGSLPPGSRVWNSLLGFEASLMGGNRWRNNGDGTVETTFPSEFWSAAPPYQGQSLSRFADLELYLMGLLPAQALTPIADYTDRSGIEVLTTKLDERFGTPFTGLVEAFGQLPFVPVRLKDTENGRVFTPSDRLFDPVRSLLPVHGSRDPDFTVAPHFHKQLWVVVTKPNDPENTAKHIQRMVRWRRAWNAYYYLLTSYRGRMITTADGAEDDSPYWEFGQPIDDQQTFVPLGGLQVQFPGPLPAAGSPVIDTFARVVNTPGETGGLQLTPHFNQPPVRIKGDQMQPGAINALVVRMRLPAEGPQQSAALLQLSPTISVRLPSDPSSFLIADGRWHTYSADLTKVPGFAGQDWTGFVFIPSTAPAFDVDIESIRFDMVEPTQLGDRDLACNGTPQPDGFIDSHDNCPNHYNPLQQDADRNGVGDACEDFDQDGTPNLCDNCPTLTNSRQRDRDEDSIGDACDSDPGGGCFLQPESIAGTATPKAGAVLLLLSAVLIGLVVRRSRRATRSPSDS